MTQLTNFTEVHKFLAKLVPSSRDFRGQYNLDNMQDLMAKLGNPQDKYRVIHVAGTSGKTSTCYYTATLLRASGKKVGLTVSPYVDEINERLQVNLEPLPEKKFCQKLSEFLDIVKTTGVKPTYFELLVAFAFWEFANQKVDYAVVEVGLGGLLDGTNVINRADKVCVITTIGLDHTNILGRNLVDITKQKAGIIHFHNEVIMNKQPQKIMEVVQSKTEAEQATLLINNLQTDVAINNLPWFQQQNWQLAYWVYEYLVKRDDLMELNQAQIYQTMNLYIPARMEVVNKYNKTLIMDGAHNPQKMRALIRSLRLKFPDKKMTVVIGLLSGKDLKIARIIKQLKPITDEVITTAFSAEQDMPRGSIDPNDISSICKQFNITTKVISDPAAALKRALESKDKYILITGSFYLLNHIRPLIFKNND